MDSSAADGASTATGAPVPPPAMDSVVGTPQQRRVSLQTCLSCTLAAVAALVALGLWWWCQPLVATEPAVARPPPDGGITSACGGDGQRDQSDDDWKLLLDNARVLVQVLLIFHSLLYYNSIRAYDDMRTWLYGSDNLLSQLMAANSGVMVPTAVFISGVCSQGDVSSDRIRRFIKFLFVPTLVWIFVAKPVIVDPLVSMEPRQMLERGLELLSFRNFHDEWYLQSLLLWRGSVFLLWCHLRAPVALTTMLALSCAAGYFDLAAGPLRVLKLDEAFGFLPYFALGYVFPFKEACRATASPGVASASGVVGLVALWLFVVIPKVFPEPLPDAHGNFMTNHAGSVFAAAHQWERQLYWTRRLAKLLVEALPMLALILCVVPRRRTPMTRFGRHTLYPFVFHLVALAWRNRLLQLFPPPKVTTLVGHVAVLLLHVPFAFTVIVFFSSPPWRWLFQWCFEPSWLDPLMGESSPPPAGVRGGGAAVRGGCGGAEDAAGPGMPMGSSPKLIHGQLPVLVPQTSGTKLNAPGVVGSLGAATPAADIGLADGGVADMGGERPSSEGSSSETSTPPALLAPPHAPPYSRRRRFRDGFEWQALIPHMKQAREFYPYLLPIFLMILLVQVSMVGLACFRVLWASGYPYSLGWSTLACLYAVTPALYGYHYLRLRGTQRLPPGLSGRAATGGGVRWGEPPPPMLHAVVIVAYKEPLEVLSRTFESASRQIGIGRRPVLVLAAEARDPGRTDTFAALSSLCGDRAERMILTEHQLANGETRGKSSNENWAARELYRLLVLEEGFDPFQVMLTIADADSLLSSTYLAHVEARFRQQSDGRRLIYSGPLNTYRNFAEGHLLVQTYELMRCHGDTFFNPVRQHHALSNYSLTLGLASEIDFWTPDNMPEDVHTASKASLNNFGSLPTVMLPSIICNDLVTSFSDRYVQAKRHQWGITEFAWVMSLPKHMPLNFQAWWLTFSVEIARAGSLPMTALTMGGRIIRIMVIYWIITHWVMMSWMLKCFIVGCVASRIWEMAWFWGAELILWQTLLTQFRIERPSFGRVAMLVLGAPVLMPLAEFAFETVPTIHCLYQATFVGELSYVTAPKGNTGKNERATSEAAALPDADD